MQSFSFQEDVILFQYFEEETHNYLRTSTHQKEQSFLSGEENIREGSQKRKIAPLLYRSANDQIFLQKIDERRKKEILGQKRISKRQLGIGIMTQVRVTPIQDILYTSRVIIGTRNPNNNSSLAPIFKTIRSGVV